MKKIILKLLGIAMFCTAAVTSHADNRFNVTSQNLFGTTYHTYSNGLRGTSENMFGTTYHKFSNGLRGTSENMFGTTYHKFSW